MTIRGLWPLSVPRMPYAARVTPDQRCHDCGERPIRATGEYVTKLESWTDQRLYCEPCAAMWESGDYDALGPDAGWEEFV